MKRKTVKYITWALLINLFLNIAMHFNIECNASLNYIATTIAAFALGFYVQEYCYGKSE